jgi:arylsulfatase A-like enzyme
MWAYYLANVTMIDEKIGDLLQSLDDQGYLDNAVVIFVSDHGDCMGDHGQIQKWTFYEEIIRTPCIVWSKNPDLIAGGGRRVDGLCQLFDLGPTILEMAGASVPDDFEARSLRGALRNESWQARDYVFCEQGADTNLTGTRMESMVRSERWKLVHFLGEDAGQLFDLESDPKELRNLWDDPDHAETKCKMREVLFNWRLESGYATRNWCMDSR